MALGAAWAANPFLRFDTAEYQGLIAQHFRGAIPPALSEDDGSFLKVLIGLYAPLGVDVSDAAAALVANEKRLEAERQDAQAQEEARRKQATEDLRKKREADAMRASIRYTKKAKAAKKGKKKGKTR
jgi:hypothetical protein